MQLSNEVKKPRMFEKSTRGREHFDVKARTSPHSSRLKSGYNLMLLYIHISTNLDK